MDKGHPVVDLVRGAIGLDQLGFVSIRRDADMARARDREGEGRLPCPDFELVPTRLEAVIDEAQNLWRDGPVRGTAAGPSVQ